MCPGTPHSPIQLRRGNFFIHIYFDLLFFLLWQFHPLVERVLMAVEVEPLT
jgi:hypothetical protein